MRRFVLLTFLLLAACRQEITSDANAPALTLPPTLEAVPTVAVPTEAVLEITSTPTTIPATPTLVSFPSAQALPAGPIGILTMGDSLTQGDGDETGRGYPGRLLEKVTQLRPASTLSNFGQSGWNSDALINGDQGRFGQLPLAIDESKVILSRGRGALVLLWIGSNDLWYLYEYGGDVTSGQELQDAEHFASNLDLILVPLREAGAQVVVALLDDQSKRPVALKGEAFTGITPAELTQMSAQVQRYNAIIEAKADQYGALTVDFYNTSIFTDPATLSDDGNHPNQAGYDLIAEKWFEVIAPLLNSG